MVSANLRVGRTPAQRHSESGFTLIEILVVITIIGLIMAVVGPRVLNYLTESKIKAARIQIESLGNALDLLYLDTGQYPSASEGLNALLQRPGGMKAWNGPYLKGRTIPIDPWGRQYVYHTSAQNGRFEIISYGADGQEGGTGAGADIVSRTE